MGGARRGDLATPPTCGSSAKSNDLVKLGKLLREHGFAVGENAEMGDNPPPGVHSVDRLPLQVPQLGRAGRQPRPVRRGRAIDAIIAPLHEARLPHDLARGGPLRPHPHRHRELRPDRRRLRHGGAVGALEETMLDVKLIDWDAEYLPFGGFGWLGGGGYYGGPPDPDIARVICRVLDRYNASPEGAAGGVRGRDRRVRRAQPQLRRPRLARRLPAAPGGQGLGHRGADHEPGPRGDDVHHDARSSNNGGQSAGQLAQDVQVSAFPERYDQVQLQAYGADGEVLLMQAGARALCARSCSPGCGVLDDEGPALSQGPDPAVYGPREAVPREPPDDRRSRGCESPIAEVARELDARRDRRRRHRRRDRRRARPRSTPPRRDALRR